MDRKKSLKILKNRWVVAVALVVLGAALRIWPLGLLETRVPWLTFYPVVMLAAVYGGLFAGLLAGFLSCLTLIFLWPVLAPHSFFQVFADWLGMAVFFVNCALISYIAESMRRAQRKAKKSQEEAEAANRAKSVFLANMSHELRTPLNAILGFSRILNSSPDMNPEQKASLEIITRSGENLLNLINNILDISRIESGRIVLEESDTDLHSLIEEVKSLLNVKAVEKNLDFTVETSPGVPRFIRVDQGKLRQVLINLVGNAIKFTSTGRVIVRTAVTKQEPNRGIRLRFEVEDTGPGIKNEDREKLFLPFARLETEAYKEAGTGLGLVISKENVELMGGEIGIAGEYGKGSLFYFEIQALTVSARAAALELQQRRITGLSAGQPQYRLLIAEDQPDSRLLLRKILEPFGFELREAVNGQEAVKAFEEWHPDLIWMDIRMPLMSGMEATRRIRQMEPGAKTRIIALTAHALSEERSEILSGGFDDFIRKPYQERDIFESLAKHLGVQFLYNDSEAPVERKLTEQDLTELGRLDPAIVRDLVRAVEELDGKVSSAVIHRISAISPVLGEHLLGMINKMQYQELLLALDNLAGKGDV